LTLFTEEQEAKGSLETPLSNSCEGLIMPGSVPAEIVHFS